MDKNLKEISSPLITVFMAAYNAAEFIEESINSILTQTFSDFELLIIDDGSKDNTVEKILAIEDPRIRLLRNQENKGLTFTRNRGIAESRSEYIAILDSDDIALPNRLLLQYNFMKQHPDVAVCGGQAYLIDENGKEIGCYPHIPSGIDLGMQLLFRNIFINPACMIKKSIVEHLGGYRDYSPAEDFDLFVRIAKSYKVANLERFIIKYRFHTNNISGVNSNTVRRQELRILRQMQEYLGAKSNPTLLDIHHSIYLKNYEKLDLNKSSELLLYYLEANKHSKIYPNKLFEKYLFETWITILQFSKNKKNIVSLYFKKGLFSWRFFNMEDLFKLIKISLRNA